jgi:hypothetical protein
MSLLTERDAARKDLKRLMDAVSYVLRGREPIHGLDDVVSVPRDRMQTLEAVYASCPAGL